MTVEEAFEKMDEEIEYIAFHICKKD